MKRQPQGFTLLEVLIALVITAIGILGVAGLQVVSLQQNRNALLRDQALQAGNDIIDRMRANADVDYAPVDIDADPVSTAMNCVGANCDTDQMAVFDVAQWKCRINPVDATSVLYPICVTLGIQAASLPGGKGGIAMVAGVLEVSVEWINDRDGNTSSIVLRTRINE